MEDVDDSSSPPMAHDGMCLARLSVSQNELIPFRPRLMLASPKQGFYKFDSVSTEHISKGAHGGSNESINSTTSQ